MAFKVSLEGAAIEYYLRKVKPRGRRRALVDGVLRDLERDVVPREFRLAVSRAEADSLRFVLQRAAAPSSVHTPAGRCEQVGQALGFALSERLAVYVARIPVSDPSRLLPRLFWQKPLHVIRVWYYEEPEGEPGGEVVRRQVFCMRVRP